MPSNAIDSLIFKDMYGTDELRAVFSDEQLVQCWLDYEAALARAEAEVGLVPVEAAAEISRKRASSTSTSTRCAKASTRPPMSSCR